MRFVIFVLEYFQRYLILLLLVFVQLQVVQYQVEALLDQNWNKLVVVDQGIQLGTPPSHRTWPILLLLLFAHGPPIVVYEEEAAILGQVLLVELRDTETKVRLTVNAEEFNRDEDALLTRLLPEVAHFAHVDKRVDFLLSDHTLLLLVCFVVVALSFLLRR